MTGRQLRAARAALDLNQAELADLAFVNRNTVHKYETLDTLPDTESTKALVAAVTQEEGITYHDGLLVVA